MVQIKRSVRPEYLSVFAFIFLCWSPHCQGFMLPQQDQRRIWHTQSLQNNQLSPPHHPPPPPPQPMTLSLSSQTKLRSTSSQFSVPHVQEFKPNTSTAKTSLFAFCPLTESEVSKLLLSSHPTTCPLDPIPLTPSPSYLSFTLTSTHTHHQHISPYRHLPQCIQAGSSNPTAKKTTLNTSLTDSYRPVSLLPFIANTLERVVFNQLSSFLLKHNLLGANQSGFRHSTETALLSVTEALRIAKADSKSSVLILLDLSAAFDTVNHQILLSTLSSLDITGIPLLWFESYLTGRSFKVAWGGEVSKAHQLITGVPQGSVLGPLLFSTYTTSLGPIIQAHGFSHTIAMLMTHSSISHFDQMIQR